MDISFTQHTAESRPSINTLLNNNPNKALPMESLAAKWPAFSVDQSQNDPYAWAQQVAEIYADNLEPSARLALLASPKLPVDMELEARALSRQIKSSSDSYQAAQTELAAQKELAEAKGLRSQKNTQGTPAHIAELENVIGIIHDNYQKTYADINQKAAEYMKDVNTAVGKISDNINAGKEGKIKFELMAFVKDMNSIFSKYTSYQPPTSTDKDILNVEYNNWSPNEDDTIAIHTFKGDEDAKNFWEKKLGDGFIVKQSDDKKEILILPNLDPIRNIYSSAAKSPATWKSGDGSDISSQAFQSLQAAIDSQKNAVNSSVSQLLERFRQDNSTFETFIQLLVQMTKDLHQYNQGYMQ
ncbi:TPA: hypothetical protein ACQ31I_002552 [Yersinia enterocolitica]